MKTGAEGLMYYLGWYTNEVKWLKDHWTPGSGYFHKKK